MASAPIQEADLPFSDRVRQLVATGECVLFLGAGVSLDAGAPDAQTLSDEIGRDFFGFPNGTYPLSEVADLVDADLGRRRLNEWLVERFRGLKPAGATALIPCFRWKAIYTTNFDTLVEQAYSLSDDPIQRVHPIYSDRDPLSRIGPDEVALYKLHGCLSRANSDEGRLVLTQDDFARVEASRQRLFNRLLDHAADFPILYVGFRRADPDFARVLASVERAVGRLSDLSRSYALQPGFTEPDAKRAELKKVTLVDSKAGEFFTALHESIDLDTRRLGSLATAPPRIRSQLSLRKPDVEDSLTEALAASYEILDDAVSESRADPEAFFKGTQASWGTIAAGHDARRDALDSILDAVLIDPQLDRSSGQFFLLHAEAGTGKTTLLRRLGYELWKTWERVVISLKPFGVLDFLDLERLVVAAEERIYVLVDDPLRVAFELRSLLSSARRAGTKITVIGAARTNEWREAQDAGFPTVTQEFELGLLSLEEIDQVLDRLAESGNLGYLDGVDRQKQQQAFVSRAGSQLLVALREATEGKGFDEIVVNEYEQIPTEESRRAYLLIAALHRFGLLTRAAVLHRAVRVPLADLGRKVFAPAAKIVVPVELTREAEPYYSTRHPLIAQLVFDRQVPTETQRLDYYLTLIRQLDLGYASDADTYRRLSRSLNRQLLRDFQRHDSRRELMREIAELDPSDAYVHQHAAMMELSFGDLRVATAHIARAIVLRPDDIAIRDTEGRIVLAGAAREDSIPRRLAKFGEAEAIFARNISRRPDEPYGYRHLAQTYWERSLVETDPARRVEYIGKAYRTLLDGLEQCMSGAMLLQYQADIEEALGNREEAQESLRRALAERPDEITIRLMAARLAERSGDSDAAIELLRDGLETTPDAWELHFRLSRLLAERTPDATAEIRRHFVAALLAPMRRYLPRLTYAAWLFSQREYEEAGEQFSRLEEVELPARERFELRTFRFGDLGQRHRGRVTRLSVDNGHVEYDRGATRIFFRMWDLDENVRRSIRVQSEVSFDLRFNLLGPVARNLRLA